MAATQVLLIEDDNADVELLRRGLRDYSTLLVLHVAGSGQAALEYLQSPHEPRPDLIILDLHLPHPNGHELLQYIKSDPELALIPVIVLSTSSDRDEIKHTYELQANCYVRKPSNVAELTAMTRALAEFWLLTAQLPDTTIH